MGRYFLDGWKVKRLVGSSFKFYFFLEDMYLIGGR